MAILEGLAAEIPFVATNVGDCRALLEGERDDDRFGPAGLIVPVMNSEAMAQAIQKERNVMGRALRCQLFFVYESQLIITVVLVCLASVFFPYLNASAYMLRMFVILSLGVYAVFCMYFTIVVFYYFSDYGGACTGSLVFLAVTVLGAAAAVFADDFYPLPLLLGGLCGWIVAFLLLRRRMEKLDSFLMC